MIPETTPADKAPSHELGAATETSVPGATLGMIDSANGDVVASMKKPARRACEKVL